LDQEFLEHYFDFRYKQFVPIVAAIALLARFLPFLRDFTIFLTNLTFDHFKGIFLHL